MPVCYKVVAGSAYHEWPYWVVVVQYLRRGQGQSSESRQDQLRKLHIDWLIMCKSLR